MFEEASGGGGELSCLGVPPHCAEKWETSVDIRAAQYFIVSTEADILLSPPPSPLWAFFQVAIFIRGTLPYSSYSF